MTLWPGIRAPFVRALAILSLCATHSMAQQGIAPDPGCSTGQAWTEQNSPLSDGLGVLNLNYGDANVTYWEQWVNAGPPGAISNITIHGQFPLSRYMALSLYDSNDDVLANIHDSNIVPDAGTNNPFVSAGSQGTYTITISYLNAPPNPAANTLYTGGQTQVKVVYRVTYPNSAGTLTGGTTNPALPTITVFGGAMPTCAPRPIVSPATNTVWGRLSVGNFAGVKPAQGQPPTVTSTPTWQISTSLPGLNANADNSYMTAYLSRNYLTSFAPLLVVKFMAPTFPNTQNGVPVYTTGEQVRYWSLCTNDPLTTAVARCLTDAQSATQGGYATFVISDPAYQPSASVLAQWGATWLPWGALEYSTDFLYNENYQQITSDPGGAFYYNVLIYRQTLPSSSFTQSIASVSSMPTPRQQSAMGAYWPSSGYCSAAAFQLYGSGCF